MVLLGKPWRYINEGNVHIVLQLEGTEHVIRLIKEDSEPIDFTKIKSCVDFVNLVMIPLIFTSNYNLQKIIQLSEEELTDLDKNLSKFRPKNRIFKSVISPYAVQATNLTIYSPKSRTNYCVEIKPKEGLKSKNLKQYSKCYYCLKQFLKLQEQQIERLSEYCPLHLFSGDRNRMKAALMSLVNNPQNNFKIFKDSTLIYNENSSRDDIDHIVKNMGVFEGSTSLFLDFIIEVLLSNRKNLNIILKPCKVETLLPYTNCIEDTGLDKNAFLYNLLFLQKLSETLDFDTTGDHDNNLEYVASILNTLRTKNLDLILKNDRDIFYKTENSKHLALISALARDCSIMISFSANFEEEAQTIQIGGNKVPFKVAVTDLEPKPAKTLEKRKKMESKLLDVYKKITESSRMETQGKIQPHTETRTKQLEAWQQLISEYMKNTKQSTIDIREAQNSPLFNNATINRKLSQESVLTILEYMARNGRAEPVDKSKNVWEVYWHSLDEWGNMVYNWACNNGMNNSVCTLFELREGDNTVDEEFHGLDLNILIKALKSLQTKGKCELMEFEDNQGVKFF